MRKQSFLLMSFLVASFGLLAQDYAMSVIPLSLIESSVAVKRTEEMKLEVLSMNRMKWHKKYAITILSEAGDKYAEFYEYYDKLRSVHSIKGSLFDATGKKIKSLKKSDIRDRSAVNDASLFDDNRIKLHHFYYKTYPYTVEYEVTVDFNTTYFFPRWMPQPYSNYAVQQSSCQVICPNSFTFRYKTFNYAGEPVITEKENKKIYLWKVTNLAPWSYEYASPKKEELTTSVYFSTDKFEFERYKGSMNSWQELGLFQYQLNRGRDQLPETVKQKVQSLINGIEDEQQKVRVLYEYLQQNTRYVSIQLGIGGWQPFDANFVAAKAYGDCKALSNYMCALLKEANIKAYYTLIKAGQGEFFFMPDFPADQFNHIIVCVPLQKDTMWLECTNQFIPPGYIGDFTDNRYALLVDESGGKLVRTPHYGRMENFQNRITKARLLPDGTLQATIQSQYNALQQDNIMNVINHLSRDKLREYLHKQLDFPTYTVDDFRYSQKKGILPAIDETLNLTVNNYATITGRRVFITPNVMTRSYRKPGAAATRKYDIELDTEYRDLDTAEIELPQGYELESIPDDVSISTPFGNYSCSVKLVENKLFYYRRMEQYSGHFPATDYPELVKFYETIYKSDRNRVVLVKKENLRAF